MNKKKSKTRNRRREIEEEDTIEPIELLITDFEKFNDVERSFNQILEIENETERVKILVEFSQFLTNNGFFPEAKVYCAMIEENYQDSDAYKECARVYYGHKEYGKCIEMNKHALINHSDNPEQIQSDMGLALMKNGNLEESIVLLESTIKDNPEFVDAYINLALCYKEQNDYTKALSALESAIKIDKSNPKIYSNIGCIYHLQEKYEDAIVNFLKSQEYDGQNAETLNNLGLSLMKIRNLDYAFLTFEQALTLEPGNPDILNNYMLCLLIGKQFAKFMKMLQSIKRLISEVKYEKHYKSLYNKFVKACGFQHDDTRSMIKDSIVKNRMQSESSWDGGANDPKDHPLGLKKSAFSKGQKKQSLISIAEESSGLD